MIDLKELRKIASQGLPDDAGIRSLVWKVPNRISLDLNGMDLSSLLLSVSASYCLS